MVLEKPLHQPLLKHFVLAAALYNVNYFNPGHTCRNKIYGMFVLYKT